MTLLRSALAGLAAAVLFSAAWILVAFVLPIWAPFVLSRFSSDGAGGAYASISSGSILLAALIGFAFGFLWRLRK
jgi:hypothetical protein